MENKKEIILKVIVALGLFAFYALPEYGKELFVSKTGTIGHPNLFLVLLLACGILWGWKFLKQIVLIYSSTTLIVVLFMFFSIQFNIQKPGFLILIPIVTLTLFATYKLMKLEANKKKGDSLVSSPNLNIE